MEVDLLDDDSQNAQCPICEAYLSVADVVEHASTCQDECVTDSERRQNQADYLRKRLGEVWI